MKLRAVVIDDEQAAIDTLSDTINSYFSDRIQITAHAFSVAGGVAAIAAQNPDVIFLDVQMGDGNGFDLLKKIPRIHFKIIFTTAHSDYAAQAFRFCALDYLLKPVNKVELEAAIDRLFEAKETENIDLKLSTLLNNLDPSLKKPKRLILNSLESIEIVEINDIIRCEAENNYTRFHLKCGKKLLISKTLKEYDKLLTPNGFFRIHASHLINLSYIKRIDKKNGNLVLLTDNSVLPISLKRKEDLLLTFESLQ